MSNGITVLGSPAFLLLEGFRQFLNITPI